jgi:hypothetical protein
LGRGGGETCPGLRMGAKIILPVTVAPATMVQSGSNTVMKPGDCAMHVYCGGGGGGGASDALQAHAEGMVRGDDWRGAGCGRCGRR